MINDDRSNATATASTELTEQQKAIAQDAAIAWQQRGLLRVDRAETSTAMLTDPLLPHKRSLLPGRSAKIARAPRRRKG